MVVLRVASRPPKQPGRLYSLSLAVAGCLRASLSPHQIINTTTLG